jgi:hypothetical protein
MFDGIYSVRARHIVFVDVFEEIEPLVYSQQLKVFCK